MITLYPAFGSSKRREADKKARQKQADARRLAAKAFDARLNQLPKTTALENTPQALDTKLAFEYPLLAAAIHRRFQHDAGPVPIIMEGDRWGHDALALRIAQAGPILKPGVAAGEYLQQLARKFPVTRRDTAPSELQTTQPDADWADFKILRTRPVWPVVTRLLTPLNRLRQTGLQVDPLLADTLGDFKQGNITLAPPEAARREVRMMDGVWHYLGDPAAKARYLRALASQQAPGSLLILGQLDADHRVGIPQSLLRAAGYQPATDPINPQLIKALFPGNNALRVNNAQRVAAQASLMQMHGWSPRDLPIFVWERTATPPATAAALLAHQQAQVSPEAALDAMLAHLERSLGG